MTVDVEDYFQVSAFANVVDRADWPRHELRVERNTHRLLDLFDVHDIKSTFFVLGWVAQRCPSLVREIARRGHEIASHGYSHKLIYEQTPQEFREESARTKEILEDQAQCEVLGYRAASYSITLESLWALDILAELGFIYDSSIVPVRHDLYGVPSAPRVPHELTTIGGHTLVEFPPSTLALGPLNLPVAGGGYFRLYPFSITKAALRWLNAREKLPFIFYLHPWELDTGQPRLQGTPFSRFRHYNNIEKCEARLKALIKTFKFTTAQTVLRDYGLLGANSQRPGR